MYGSSHHKVGACGSLLRPFPAQRGDVAMCLYTQQGSLQVLPVSVWLAYVSSSAIVASKMTYMCCSVDGHHAAAHMQQVLHKVCAMLMHSRAAVPLSLTAKSQQHSVTLSHKKAFFSSWCCVQFPANHRYSQEFVGVVERCLKMDPAKRPSMKEVVLQLGALLP